MILLISVCRVKVVAWTGARPIWASYGESMAPAKGSSCYILATEYPLSIRLPEYDDGDARVNHAKMAGLDAPVES